MNSQISFPTQRIADFCRAHAIRELAVFGSVTREDFTPTSDIDVLIDLHSEARVGLVTLQRMRDELADILGRPVDLVTRAGLNRHIRDAVENDAEVVYAE